jgi:hypothetical protein
MKLNRLMALVAGIESATPQSLEDARFIKRTVTEFELPADQTIFELKAALTTRISEIQAEGDDHYSAQTMQELAGAVTAVDAQIEGYGKKFMLAKSDQIVDDQLSLIAHDGGMPGAEIADQALKTRANGADHARA